jgi:hypothetical protein
VGNWGGPLSTQLTQLRQAKGPPKKKIGDPHGGWVGQRPKKDQGQIYVFDIFLWCFFLLPSPRNTQKRNKKKSFFSFRFYVDFL